MIFAKKCKLFERWGLRPQNPKTAPHCEFLATPVVIDDRFDRKIAKPIANNLSTVAELGIAVLNLLNFCNHASFL